MRHFTFHSSGKALLGLFSLYYLFALSPASSAGDSDGIAAAIEGLNTSLQEAKAAVLSGEAEEARAQVEATTRAVQGNIGALPLTIWNVRAANPGYRPPSLPALPNELKASYHQQKMEVLHSQYEQVMESLAKAEHNLAVKKYVQALTILMSAFDLAKSMAQSSTDVKIYKIPKNLYDMQKQAEENAVKLMDGFSDIRMAHLKVRKIREFKQSVVDLFRIHRAQRLTANAILLEMNRLEEQYPRLQGAVLRASTLPVPEWIQTSTFDADPSVESLSGVLSEVESGELAWEDAAALVSDVNTKAATVYQNLSSPNAADQEEWEQHEAVMSRWNDLVQDRQEDLDQFNTLVQAWQIAIHNLLDGVAALDLGTSGLAITPVGESVWLNHETLSETPQPWPNDYRVLPLPNTLKPESWLRRPASGGRPDSLAAGLDSLSSYVESLQSRVDGYETEARLAVASLTARDAYDYQSQAANVIAPYAISILSGEEMRSLRANLVSLREEAADFDAAVRLSVTELQDVLSQLEAVELAAQACFDHVEAHAVNLPPAETLRLATVDLSGFPLPFPDVTLLDWTELRRELEDYVSELERAVSLIAEQTNRVWDKASELENRISRDIDFNHQLAQQSSGIASLRTSMDLFRSGYFGSGVPSYLYQSLRFIDNDLRSLLLPAYETDPSEFPRLRETLGLHLDYVRSLGSQSLSRFTRTVEEIRQWTDQLIWAVYHFPGNVIWSLNSGFSASPESGLLVFPENREIANHLVAARWSSYNSRRRTEMEEAGFLTPRQIDLGLPRLASWLGGGTPGGQTEDYQLFVVDAGTFRPLPGDVIPSRLDLLLADGNGDWMEGVLVALAAIPEAGISQDLSAISGQGGLVSFKIGPFTQSTQTPLSFQIDGHTVLSLNVRFDSDNDGDGLPNQWESRFGLDPNLAYESETDHDGDGLSVEDEYRQGSHPQLADSDADGITDGEEWETGSDPTDHRSVPESNQAIPLPPLPQIGQDWRVIGPPPIPYVLRSSVAVGDNETLMIATTWKDDTQDLQTAYTLTTTDFVEWNSHLTPEVTGREVVFCAGQYVAISVGDIHRWTGQVWELIDTPLPWVGHFNDLYCAAWRDRIYVAASGQDWSTSEKYNHIWSSSNGTNWEMEFENLDFLTDRVDYAIGVWKDTLILGGGFRRGGNHSSNSDYFTTWHQLKSEEGTWESPEDLFWSIPGMIFHGYGALSIIGQDIYLSGLVNKGNAIGSVSETWRTTNGFTWELLASSEQQAGPHSVPWVQGPGGLYAIRESDLWHSGYQFPVDAPRDASPTPVIGRSTRLAAAYFHVLALDGAGKLWGWGLNSNLAQPNPDDYTEHPALLDDTHRWTCVTAAQNASLGIREDGTLWAWGWSPYYALGLPTDRSLDAFLQVGTDSDWALVSTSGMHTLAVKTDGTLWGWGSNYLGIAGQPGGEGPFRDPLQIGTDKDWVHVSAGYHVSIAMKADGSAWKWGHYWGHSQGHVPEHAKLRDDGWITTPSSPVIDSLQSESLDALLTEDGRLWLRGLNTRGEMGNGTTDIQPDHADPVPSTAWAAFAMNSQGTVAAIRWNNSLWTWGPRPGNSAETDLVPRQLGQDRDWIEVLTHPLSGYFLARKKDGSLWAFGEGDDFVFGNGTRSNLTELPVPVTEFDTYIEINPDADGNGLPDAWEIAMSGATGMDPQADEDGDGLTTRAEWIAGTHPGEQGSQIDLTLESIDSENLELSWAAQEDRTDLLYYSNDMKRWRLMELQPPVQGSGDQLRHQETIPAGRNHFFRLERGIR